jgi:hypothetical protein
LEAEKKPPVIAQFLSVVCEIATQQQAMVEEQYWPFSVALAERLTREGCFLCVAVEVLVLDPIHA